MRVRLPRSRSGLRWVSTRLENVSFVEFPKNAVPEVTFDRLNGHYREVVALARLILRHTSFETGRGGNRAPGFLMDMNVVFQDFVTQSLREALGVSDRTFRSDTSLHHITLDEAGRVLLEPDLSWWDGSTCTFVGDAKYKRVRDERVPNADLYQLLAYTTALDLPGGLLIYAQGEAEQVAHQVRCTDKRLEVAALDLSGTIDELLAGINKLAERIGALRQEAYRVNRAA
jgi:5-methylcytosine-specific restriction enzyme subunit McrC